jgi:hypothetical protein
MSSKTPINCCSTTAWEGQLIWRRPYYQLHAISKTEVKLFEEGPATWQFHNVLQQRVYLKSGQYTPNGMHVFSKSLLLNFMYCRQYLTAHRSLKISVQGPDYCGPLLMHGFIQSTYCYRITLQSEIIFLCFDKYRKIFTELQISHLYFTTQFTYHTFYFEKIDKFLFQLICKAEVNTTFTEPKLNSAHKFRSSHRNPKFNTDVFISVRAMTRGQMLRSRSANVVHENQILLTRPYIDNILPETTGP